MHCFRKSIGFFVVMALVLAAWLTSDCHADCMACWQLKGVVVHLKNGTTIKGYATWNESWAAFGYQSSGLSDKKSIDRALVKNKFPKAIFDPKAQIDGIIVYTHLRSIKYPVANALVTLRDPIRVNKEDIKDLKVNPGPHDGYDGAGRLPLVSERIDDLLQTKPSAVCEYDAGLADGYCISYDKNFPKKELERLCRDDKARKRLQSRDIFCLYWAYD
jgi:hypothetical protein